MADFTGGKELYTELGPQLESLDIGILSELNIVFYLMPTPGPRYMFVYVQIEYTL